MVMRVGMMKPVAMPSVSRQTRQSAIKNTSDESCLAKLKTSSSAAKSISIRKQSEVCPFV